MRETKTTTLCRPDLKHWCVECCPDNCSFLGTTNDGIPGCGLHDNQNRQGFSQRSICREFNCTQGLNQKQIDKIASIISERPPGQFFMSDILKRNTG